MPAPRRLLRVVSAAPTAKGWDLAIRCSAVAAEDAELRVRVLANGAARCEDAFDLPCARATRLELNIPVDYIDGHDVEAGPVAVGAAVHFRPAIFGDFKGSEDREGEDQAGFQNEGAGCRMTPRQLVNRYVGLAVTCLVALAGAKVSALLRARAAAR